MNLKKACNIPKYVWSTSEQYLLFHCQTHKGNNMGEITLRTKITSPNIGYRKAEVFNAYSLKAIDDILLIAFILRDTNGYFISSTAFSAYKADLLPSIDSWANYIGRISNIGEIRTTDNNIQPYDFKNPYNITGINVISSKNTSCEIKLSLFSHFAQQEAIAKKVIAANKSCETEIQAEPIALMRSSLGVHANFVYDLIEILKK